MHISRHFMPLALAALAGSTITASHSRAALINWTSASGGTATTLTNWNPQALPTASDTINFNIVGGYVVTWGPGSPSTVTNLHVGISNAGFNFATPLTVTGDCIIQNVSSSAGGASTVSSGTLTVANLIVGAAPHPTIGGQFHVNGATAHLAVGNACTVGGTNDGLLRVLTGASMTCNAPIRLGTFEPGTMVVSGTTGSPVDRSTLQLIGTTNTLRVGDGSQGSLTISDGALVTLSGDALAGPVSGVQGSVTVTGASAGLDATLTIPGNLYVANNNAAGAAGVGTVRIQPGGSVSVAGQTIVGDSSPSSGLLELSGGTYLTHGLIASGGNGTFVHSTGTAIIDGGPLAIQTGGGIYNIAGTLGGGVLTLRNNAQWTLPAPGFSANQVFLTSVGAGSTLNLQTGSNLVHTGSELRIGISNQRGTLTIEGGSTLTTNAALNAGGTDSAISVSGGSSLTTGTMNIAGNTGDTLSISVTGVGSTLNTAGLIRVGHNLTGGGGECLLSLTSGAVLNSTFVDPTQGSIRFRRVNGMGGSLAMSQAVVNATDEVEYSNTVVPLTMTASVINAPHLALNGATLSGDGTINANLINTGQILPSGPGFTLLRNLDDNGTGVSGTRLTFGSGGSYTGDGLLDCEVAALAGGSITPSGDVTMGKSTSPSGFSCLGDLNIGANDVTLRDTDGATLSGVTNVAGGTLACSSGLRFTGGTLPFLRGFGAITDGDTTMNGRIEPGIAAGDQTGHIDFVTLTMGATASLVIDIEGEAAGEFDTIATIDEFDLGGVSSLIVNRLNNFFPTRGARFTIITGGRFDTFGTVLAPGFHVEYLPTRVDLVFDGLCDSVDFNNDELFPDTADIDDLLSVFSGGPCTNDPNCNDIDFNNDGLFPDTADIDDMLRVFSGGPCVV